MQLLYRFLFTLAICCAVSISASAQTPKIAAGIRLGYPWSLSLKVSPGEGDNAIEAFLGYRRRGSIIGGYGWSRTSIGALYEIHQPLELDELDGLQFYFGGGGSLLFYSYDDGLSVDEDFSDLAFGILFVGGLNYTLPDTPLNFSIDWMPRVYIGDGYDTGFGFGYGAISARYVISR